MLALLVVALIGFGMLTNYAFQSAFVTDSSDQANSSVDNDNNSGAHSSQSGSRYTLREGSEVLSGDSDREAIRDAARDLDRLLLDKLKDKNRQKSDVAEVVDHDFDAKAMARRAKSDYAKVKKASHLSQGMKDNFKKHYRNVTMDN